MKSDNKYTPEQEKTLWRQYGSIGGILLKQSRPFDIVKNLQQGIIADDRIVTIVPKVVNTKKGKVYNLRSNFGSLREAVDCGSYDHQWGYAHSRLDEVPHIVQPVSGEFRIIELGQYNRTNLELFDLYPTMASPMEILTFGHQNPKAQLEGSILTVWKSLIPDKFWCAILSECNNGKRALGFSKSDPDEDYASYYRVLVRE